MLNTVWVYVLSWFKSIREVWFAFLFFCQPIKESWPASSPIHCICVNMVVLLLLINWLDNLCFSGIFLVNDFSGLLKKCLNLNTKLGLRKPRQMEFKKNTC